MIVPKNISSYAALEALGRVRLSPNFFMRDFLYSEIANYFGVPNYPDDPSLAVEVGTRLCEELLEPLQATFGRIEIRSAYRSCVVNQLGNEKNLNCASNEKNYAGHIWDRRDANGHMGATACIVVPWFADRYAEGTDWRAMAWWIHDYLDYSSLYFFPTLAAFNISWHERPERLSCGSRAETHGLGEPRRRLYVQYSASKVYRPGGPNVCTRTSGPGVEPKFSS